MAWDTVPAPNYAAFDSGAIGNALSSDIWHGARWLANKGLGYGDPINDVLPTSESLRKRREAFAGPDYEPETTAGKRPCRVPPPERARRPERTRRSSAHILPNMRSSPALRRKLPAS